MTRNKLKVSTKYIGSLEKKDKILEIMKIHPEGIQPKYLAFLTKINVNTIKSILRILELEGKVKRKPGLRGFYYLVENTTHNLFSYKLHNLVLRFKSNKINIEERKSEVNNLNQLIKFRFEIGKNSKQATMGVSTDYPFEIPSLLIIVVLFQELINKYCSITPELNEIELVNVEFNKDHLGYRFEGLNSFTIDNYATEFKLYQKERGIREEYKTKVPFKFDLIEKVLQQGIISTEINEKLKEQEQDMNRISKENSQIKEIVNNIQKLMYKKSG